ncbi:hypothetical protein B1790_00485 [Mycobacterium sp. AT1]|nr:hypothetical protein B1790_00485 [Mycobacterium sp. AT1]
MGASAHVGRIGGLAAALGIGAVIGLGCGVASADTTGQSTSSSSSSSSESAESAKSASGSSPGQATSSVGAHEDAGTPTKVSTGKPPRTVTITGKPHRGSRSTPVGSAAATAKPDTEPSSNTAAPAKDTEPAKPVTASEADVASSPTIVESPQATTPEAAKTAPTPTPVTHDAVTAVPAAVVDPTGPHSGGSPSSPPDSPVSWTVAAAARKETLVPATPAVSSDAGVTPKLAAAVTAAAPPVAVIQTPPLAWLQRVPVIGPVFVTPIVAAIHMVPIVGDVIHPFIGYPVQPGAPGAPVSRDVMITSFDGTKIYVHFMPASGLRAGTVAPTILEGPGLGMPGSTSLEVTPLDGILTDALGAVGVGTLRHAGYNVVTWDPRGEYRSGGVLQLDSADYEARDVSAIVSWLATQPEAQLDSPGDPRFGMVGASYGGGIQWVTAATDHRVDAIVPSISWNTLNTSLYKSAAFKSGWGTLLTAALLLTGARPNPAIYPASVQGALTGVLTAAQQALLAERGPAALLGSVTAPTLIIQGTVDTLFSLQEAQANAAALAAGVPTKTLWFCGGHGLCTNNLFDPTDGQVVTDATLNWLARYVKGQDVSTGPTFEWVDQRGQYYSSNPGPTAAGVPIVAASGRAGVLPLVPLIFGSGPLFGVLPIGATKAANAFNLAIPTVTTTTYVVGAPQVTLTYSGTGTSRHVFAQLVDDSTGAVLGNQATPIPVTLDGKTRTISISLEPVAQTLRPGQTLTLQLVASTANYENFGAFGALTVSSLQVSLPTITDAVAVNAARTAVLT